MTRRPIVRRVAASTAALVALAAAPAPGTGVGDPPGAAGEPQGYMRTVGFSASEIAAMERGTAVARVLDEKDDNDADVLGVVRIAGTQAALIEAIRRIETFKSGPLVLQIGRFSDPPRVADLDGLRFDSQDLDDLRRCRVGDCDLKVGGSTLELARRIDWKAPDAGERASRLIKEVIVRHVQRYLAEGEEALAVYDDDDHPHSVAAEFRKILEGSPNLRRYNPAFLRYLLDFPRSQLPDVENFMYWSQEKIRKPVVSVVHACIQRVTRDGQTGYFVALKHIYDSHYFRANVEFLTLVPATRGTGGFYLVHDVRARLDPPHHFRGMVLGKVKNAMKNALTQSLERTRRRLESAATVGG
jgi:hypothetical protein